MSVLKNRRGLSRLEFMNNAKRLRKNITELLLRDFGIRDKVRKVKTQEGTELTIIEEYPEWLIVHFRERIISALGDMVSNIIKGNGIYPTTPEELQWRRHYQTEAILNCEQVLHEMDFCAEIFSVHLNKFLPFVDAIELEIKLLKGWRKSNGKLYDKLKK